MVGSVMGADLAADGEFEVTIADVREESLAKAAAKSGGKLRTHRADLSDPAAIRTLVSEGRGFDMVVGALSSRIGFAALRAVIEAGRPYCDISFMAEDFLELDALDGLREPPGRPSGVDRHLDRLQ
jgi:saccharopine dehydrogenase-like NADP-dependent oxidoreductase